MSQKEPEYHYDYCHKLPKSHNNDDEKISNRKHNECFWRHEIRSQSFLEIHYIWMWVIYPAWVARQFWNDWRRRWCFSKFRFVCATQISVCVSDFIIFSWIWHNHFLSIQLKSFGCLENVHFDGKAQQSSAQGCLRKYSLLSVRNHGEFVCEEANKSEYFRLLVLACWTKDHAIYCFWEVCLMGSERVFIHCCVIAIFGRQRNALVHWQKKQTNE